MTDLAESIRFTATDVTGTQTVEATDVQWDLPAGTIARSLASKMALPDDTPWGLRSNRTSTVLDDDVAIGDQIESDTEITIFPRSHLGGQARIGS
jgi:hypothetical protein